MNVKEGRGRCNKHSVGIDVGRSSAGQAPSGPPKPEPELQKLAYFAGKWASEGEMKPSSFGPGGKFTFIQTCEWFAGGFALVCHSEGKMREGT